MCIVFFEWSPINNRFIVCHNRDEELSRETKLTSWWETTSTKNKEQEGKDVDNEINDNNRIYYEVLSPLDVKGGGTWFGYERRTNRCAFVTNVRQKLDTYKNYKSTRGALVIKYITSSYKSALEFAQKELVPASDTSLLGFNREENNEYAGYNIILFSGHDLVYYSNRSNSSDGRTNEPESLPMGRYGLSNTLLHDPFPKVSYGLTKFQKYLNNDNNPRDDSTEVNTLKNNLKILMLDGTKCYHDKIPQTTGYSKQFEQQCSSIHVPVIDSYGTRTTILFVVDDNKISLLERNLNPISLQWEDHQLSIDKH